LSTLWISNNVPDPTIAPDEKPRRRFRFGLLTLFGLITLFGLLVSLWNPLVPRPIVASRTNLKLLEPGMTIGEVVGLVGEPDIEAWDGPSSTSGIHIYRLKGDGECTVEFVNGSVILVRTWFR
jgi:hypothetical protein